MTDDELDAELDALLNTAPDPPPSLPPAGQLAHILSLLALLPRQPPLPDDDIDSLLADLPPEAV